LAREFDIVAPWNELRSWTPASRNVWIESPPSSLGLLTKVIAGLPHEVHMADETPRVDKPMTPEKGMPKNKPDMGPKPDFKKPDKPEKDIAGKPMPDMDPPGQDESENPD
jgi:hypothetical protein